MNGGYFVVAFAEVRQFFRLLEPSCFEQLVEGVLATTVDDSWAYYNDLNVLSLDRKRFFLDLFDVTVFGQRHSVGIVAVLVESVLDWLLDLNLFL